MERNCEPMDKNWIEGVAEQGERARFREALVNKAKWRKSGGCAVTSRRRRTPAGRSCAAGCRHERSEAAQVECVLIRGDLASWVKAYLLGWKAYFGLAQTPKVWRTLDEWLRHRLRAIQLKQWRRGSTIFRELTSLGAAEHVAKRVAQNARCWWRNSMGDIQRVLTIAYFDKLGLPRLS